MTNLFQDFFCYDTLLHIISGFLLAYIGVKLITKLNGKKKIKKIIVAIFVLCFSIFCAVIWELFEFTNDFFFLKDMQKDRIIYNFSSKKMERLNQNAIENINHTILYDHNNKTIIEINGYLDIGLIDTMKDLFVNLIGSLLFSIIFYFKKE